MVQDGDYIQVIDKQTLTNISGSVLNVYYFEVLSVSGTPIINNMKEDFITWWTDWMFATLLPLQCVSAVHRGLTINNLNAYQTEFLDFDYDTPITGSVSDNFSSPTTAWSFQLARLFRTTRNGSKRIAGVPDTMVSDNVPVGNGPTAIANHIANMALGLPIADGTANEVAVRMVIPKSPIPPATLPTVFNPVASWIFRGIGSQNSRKQLL